MLSANSVDKLSSVWRLRTHSNVGGAVPIAGRCVGLGVAQVGGYGYTGAASVPPATASSYVEKAAVGERRYQAPCQRLQWPIKLPLYAPTGATTSTCPSQYSDGESIPTEITFLPITPSDGT